MLRHFISAIILCVIWIGVADAADNPVNLKMQEIGELATKLDERLIPAVNAIRDGSATDDGAARQVRAVHDRLLAPAPDSQFIIRIDAPIDDALLAEISATGAIIQNSAPQWNTVTASATISQIDVLATIGGIRTIRLQGARRHRQQGSTANLADTYMNSAQLRAKANVTGASQVIGVISDSVIDTHNVKNIGMTITGTAPNAVVMGTNPQNSGDLPPQFQLIDAGPGGGTDEGEAMMELIYDVAPGASLAFASSENSQPAMATNLLALQAAAHCNITVDDIGFFDEPYFQDGPIAQAISANAAKGVIHFSAFGNDGTNGVFQTFNPITSTPDDMANPPSGANFHNWGIGGATPQFLPVTLSAGDDLTIIMQWNQPFQSYNMGPGAQADFDLYVYAAPAIGTPLAKSITIQGTTGAPSGDPIEQLEYINRGPASKTVYVAINHFQGVRNNVIRMLFMDSNQDMTFPAGVVNAMAGYGHPTSKDCVGVGAMNYVDIKNNIMRPEPFSSKGGINADGVPYYFDPSGNQLPSAPVLYDKPEFVAPDNVDTAYFQSFQGTSCAAPNAAAVAALLLEAVPNTMQSALVAAMKKSATDATAAPASMGTDAFTGTGLINAFKAWQELSQNPPAFQLASAHNPSVYGQPVAFTAILNGGNGTPTGTIQFQIDGANAGNPVTLSGGVAVSENLQPDTGTHTIKATYSGDVTYSAAISPPLSQTVNQGSSVVNISSSANPSVLSQPVAFTATIMPVAPAGGNPAGTVQFQIDGVNADSPVTINANTASLNLSTLTAGTHTIQGLYSGDTNFAGSNGTFSQTVNLTGSVSNFVVSGFPAAIVGGVAGSYSVTAKDNFANTVTTYSGTVHFSSSDPAAILPADYTFSAADHGLSIFTAKLKTAGTQSLTVVDKATASISGTQSGIIVTAPPPPAFISPASANVQGALTGTPITFNATVNPGNTITWNFGDGTSDDSGNSMVTHTFTTPGTYQVIVTLAGPSGLQISSTIPISIVANTSELDTDGDGVPDQLETALSSSPIDPNSVPAGLPGKTTPQPLSTPKIAIKLNFAKTGLDTITTSGTLPVTPGFTPTGTIAAVDIGGVIASFTLDSHGHGISGGNQFSATIPKKGSTAKFTVKFKGSLAATLADAGLTSAKNASNQQVTVPVFVIFNAAIYQVNAGLTYTNKTGTSGSAK